MSAPSSGECLRRDTFVISATLESLLASSRLVQVFDSLSRLRCGHACQNNNMVNVPCQFTRERAPSAPSEAISLVELWTLGTCGHRYKVRVWHLIISVV